VRIEHRSSPNFTPGRDGHVPLGVVLHTTVGSAGSATAWFGDVRSGVSAHFLVGLDGAVSTFVDEADTARHAGRVLRPTAPFLAPEVDPNLITIGIEFVDDGDPHGVTRPDAQYETGAELLWALCLRWSIPLDRDHVVGHREVFAAKTCPGNLDIDRLLGRAVSLEGAP
jgi:N-acetyl-anhydromuramyl-L-alanine amidase AmpD